MKFFLLFISLLIHSHYAKNFSPLNSQRKSKRHEIKELHKRSKAYSSVQNIPENPYSPSKKYSLIITSDSPTEDLDIKNNTNSANFVENPFIREKTINVLPDENKSTHLKRIKKKPSGVLNLSNWRPKKRGKNDEDHGILVLKLHEIDFDKLLKNILEKENSKFAKERGSIENLKSEFYDQPKETKEDIQLIKSHIDQRSSEVFASSGFKIPNSIKSEQVNPLKNRSESFPETTDLNLENEISTNKESIRETESNSQKPLDTVKNKTENQNKNEGPLMGIASDQKQHEKDKQQSNITNAKETQKSNSEVNTDKDDYNFLIKQKKTSLKLFDDEKKIKERSESDFSSHGVIELKTAQLIISNSSTISKTPLPINSNDVKMNTTEKNRGDATKVTSLKDHNNKDVRSMFASLRLLPSSTLRSLLSFDHLKKNESIGDNGKKNFIKALLANLTKRASLRTIDKNLSHFSPSVNAIIWPRVTDGRSHSSKKKETVQKTKLMKSKDQMQHKSNVYSKAKKYFYGKYLKSKNKFLMSPSKHQRYSIARRTLEGFKHKIGTFKLDTLNEINKKMNYSNITDIDSQHSKTIDTLISEKNNINFLISGRKETSSLIDKKAIKSLEKNPHFKVLENSFNSSYNKFIENDSETDNASGESVSSGGSTSESEKNSLEVSGEDQEPQILKDKKQKINKLKFLKKSVNELRNLSLTFKGSQPSISFRDEIPRPLNNKKDTLYSVPAISELNHFGYQSFGEPDSVEQQYLDVEGLDEKEKHFVTNFLLDENAEEKKYNGYQENKIFASSNKELSALNLNSISNSSNISSFSPKFVDGIYDNGQYGDKDVLYPEVKYNTGLYGDNKIALLQKIRRKQRERLLFLVLQDMVRKKKIQRLQNLKERLLTLRRLEQSRQKQLSSPTMSYSFHEPMSSLTTNDETEPALLNNRYDRKYNSTLHNEFTKKVESEDINITKSEQQDDYLTPVIGGEMSSNSTQRALYDRTTIGGQTKNFRHQQSKEKYASRKTIPNESSKSNRTINNEYSTIGRKRFHLKKKDKWFPTAERTIEFNSPIRQLFLNNMYHEYDTASMSHESDTINPSHESIDMLTEDQTQQRNYYPFTNKIGYEGDVSNEDDGDSYGPKTNLKNNTLARLFVKGPESLEKINSQQEEINYNQQNNQGNLENSFLNKKNYFKDVENSSENFTKSNLSEISLIKSIKRQNTTQIKNESFFLNHIEFIENATQFKSEKTLFSAIPTIDKTINSESFTGIPKKPPSYLFEVLNPAISTPVTFYKPTAPYLQRTGVKRQFHDSFENLPKKSPFIKYSENPILNSLYMHRIQNSSHSTLNKTFFNKPSSLINADVYGPFEDSDSMPLDKYLEKENSQGRYSQARSSPFFNDNYDLKDSSPLPVQPEKPITVMPDQANRFYSLKLNEPHEYIPNYTNDFYSFSSENPSRSPTHSTFYLTTSKIKAALLTSKQKSSNVVFPSPKPFLIRHHDMNNFINEQGTHPSQFVTGQPKHSTKSLYFPTRPVYKVDRTSFQLDANKSFATQIHGEFSNNGKSLGSSNDADVDVMSMEDMYWTDSVEEIENTCKQEKGTSVVVNILAFGDSLTRGYYNKGKNHHPYTMKLQYLLNRLDKKKCFIVENEGRDGEIAFGEMPKRMEQIFNNSKKKFDWVIILGGTNDIYNTKHAGRHSATELTQNLLSIHNIALHHNCRTVVVTVPEVFCESIEMCSDMKQIRETLNENLRNYAIDHKGDVILCDLANMLGRYKNNQKLLAQFFEGGLHLKPLGYETMAKLIFESLKPFFAV